MIIQTNTLEEIGFTHAQSVVYLTLIELGSTTSGPVIEKSKLQNSVMYNAVNQLVDQGFVTFILKGKRKYFSAVDPKRLLTYIDDKRDKLKSMLPSLTSKHIENKVKQEARVFTGWKGVYTAFMTIIETLPSGAEYIGFGAGFEEQFSEEAKKFFGDFHRKRAEKKYNMKLIVNESARQQVKELMKVYKEYSYGVLPQWRYVPGFAPVGVIIFGDNVLHVALGDEPIAVIISAKQIADSQRRSFYNLWKIAKK